MQRHLGEDGGGGGGAEAAKPPGAWGLTAEGRARTWGPPPVGSDPAEDLNDELCRVCSQGVRTHAPLAAALRLLFSCHSLSMPESSVIPSEVKSKWKSEEQDVELLTYSMHPILIYAT